MLISELANSLGMLLKGKDREFSGLNTLEDAAADEVSFLANPKYAHFLKDTKACAVIVSEAFADQVPGSALLSENPYLDFARAGSLFAKPQGEFSGISPLASIHPSAFTGEGSTVYAFSFIGPRATLGKNCTVFPGAYIGEDCVLGDNCIVYPNAVIFSGVRIGKHCIIGSGAVIGADGFGFIRAGGSVQEIPQIGSVVLEDYVDVGPNSCIDKATLGATIVKSETKIDNLVQVAHNVQIGEQCFVISQVGLAGSTKLGNRVTLAGQVGAAGHLTIGDDVVVGAQAGINKSIPAATTGSGHPFMESSNYRRSMVLLTRLPELHQRIIQLEKELSALKDQAEKTE